MIPLRLFVLIIILISFVLKQKMNHRNPPVADGQRSTVPTAFLTKTYQLVDDHCVDHIISWTGDGSTFVVWRPGDFAQELLPHKFKHNNFTSFIRQINSYGFRKISQDRWEFAHEFFRRGEEHLLGRIDRRRRSSGAASTSTGNEPVLTSDSTTELMVENELLKRENARLTSENEQMKSLCDRIRRLVLNSGLDSGGGDGRTLEEVVAVAISGREGSQNTEAQLGSRRDLQEKGIWLEDLEIQPSAEEELSLQLSLSHVPRKRTCGE